MCGCIFALLAAFTPRLAMFLMWLLNISNFHAAIPNLLIGLLGFIFLPYTAVFYVLAHNPVTGLSPLGIAFVVLGVLLDISSLAGGGASGRRRRRR